MTAPDALPASIQRLIPETIEKGIYYRLYPLKDGSMSLKWWVKVWKDKKPICQSSESERYSDAVALKKKLITDIGNGHRAGGKVDQVRIPEIVDDYLSACQVGAETLKEYTYVANHLKDWFSKTKASKLTTDKLKEYRKDRVAAILAKKNPRTEEERERFTSSANTTVNRHFALLSAAMNYARDEVTPPKVLVVPHFPRTKEDNARQGFLGPDRYAELRDAFTDPAIQLLYVVAYNIGCRSGELRQFEWSMVDFADGVIRLPGRITKNGKPRTVPIFKGDMMEFLKAEKKRHDEFYPDSHFVFSRLGKPIMDFRHEWEKACVTAGCPDLLFHDLRRSAIRNMKRLHGVDNHTAMKISGHLTDSVFRRYDIVEEEDIKAVKAKVDANGTAPGRSIERPNPISEPKTELVEKLLSVPEEKLKAMVALFGV